MQYHNKEFLGTFFARLVVCIQIPNLLTQPKDYPDTAIVKKVWSGGGFWSTFKTLNPSTPPTSKLLLSIQTGIPCPRKHKLIDTTTCTLQIFFSRKSIPENVFWNVTLSPFPLSNHSLDYFCCNRVQMLRLRKIQVWWKVPKQHGALLLYIIWESSPPLSDKFRSRNSIHSANSYP